MKKCGLFLIAVLFALPIYAGDGLSFNLEYAQPSEIRTSSLGHTLVLTDPGSLGIGISYKTAPLFTTMNYPYKLVIGATINPTRMIRTIKIDGTSYSISNGDASFSYIPVYIRLQTERIISPEFMWYSGGDIRYAMFGVGGAYLDGVTMGNGVGLGPFIGINVNGFSCELGWIVQTGTYSSASDNKPLSDSFLYLRGSL